MVPSSWMGRYFNSSITFTCIIRSVMATVARYIRAEMIEVLSSDYILLARAKIHTCNVTIWYIDNIFGVPGLGDQFVDRLQPMTSQLLWLQPSYLVLYLLFQSSSLIFFTESLIREYVCRR